MLLLEGTPETRRVQNDSLGRWRKLAALFFKSNGLMQQKGGRSSRPLRALIPYRMLLFPELELERPVIQPEAGCTVHEILANLTGMVSAGDRVGSAGYREAVEIVTR